MGHHTRIAISIGVLAAFFVVAVASVAGIARGDSGLVAVGSAIALTGLGFALGHVARRWVHR